MRSVCIPYFSCMSSGRRRGPGGVPGQVWTVQYNRISRRTRLVHRAGPLHNHPDRLHVAAPGATRRHTRRQRERRHFCSTSPFCCIVLMGTSASADNPPRRPSSAWPQPYGGSATRLYCVSCVADAGAPSSYKIYSSAAPSIASGSLESSRTPSGPLVGRTCTTTPSLVNRPCDLSRSYRSRLSLVKPWLAETHRR